VEFNFDINKSLALRALKIRSFPLCRYAKILSQLFLFLCIFASALFAASFFGLQLQFDALKVSMSMLFFCVAFYELYLFVELKIKNPALPPLPAPDAIEPNQNLAEFLSINAIQAIEAAIALCKKNKFKEVTPAMVLQAALKNSHDYQILMYRLGIDLKKLQEELKNYLENQARSQQFVLQFSKDFQNMAKEALKVASLRGAQAMGEKELLISIARHDEFFKKILVEYDLKEKDIENLTLWLDAIERQIAESKKFWTKENLAVFGSLGKDFASGFTATLDQFSIDWTAQARRNIFNEIVGHKKEIDELEVVLVKSTLSNALIVGDVGVGRKSIVRALAQRCYLGSGIEELAGKKVVELRMVSLAAQVQDPEKLETMLDQIFQEVQTAGNIILVIDELDSFVEQKVSRPGIVDISGMLSKYLLMPDFHFVGITSFDGLHRKLEQNPSFLESFRKIEVLEVSEQETVRILQNLAIAMEQTAHVLVTYPAIREIINLTGRYLPSAPFPKKAIDILDEAVSYIKSQKEKVLMPSHIAKIISDKVQIPIGKMEFKEKSVLLNLENLIHQSIIGQDEAVSEIAIAMRRARSGISSKKRPMGVFLFLGPTGVGKTETAKALAKIYFNGEDKMIRLDMSEFQAIADIPRLVGQVSPVEEQGLLTTPVRENPFSLVLLDEIEKTHPNILNLFLQVFDEGHITDGQGRKVMFTNTIIICTSNAGADVIFQQTKAQHRLEKDTILDVLFQKAIFRPEFINRFDAAILFHPLGKENLLDIAQLMLASLQKNLKEKGIDFVITDSLKEKVVELSYKPEFGAREMRRVVQDKIENRIAQALLSDVLVKGDGFEMTSEFDIIKGNIAA